MKVIKLIIFISQNMLKLLIGFSIIISLFCIPPSNPIIGIYTQNVSLNPAIKQTYITATYVKYLEMSGAQIIPLFYNQSQTSLLATLQKINGVFFTGGADYDINSTYVNNADFILKYAIQQNDKGNVFPIWGTCLGHELLSYLTSGYDPLVLKRVTNQTHNVNTIQILDSSNNIFKNWQPRHFKAASEQNGVFYFSHNWAIYTDYFRSNQYLSNFWDLIATTTSSQGQQFVSVQTAKKYPFYSIQFHPEVNAFNWNIDANRTLQGIQIPQLLSNFYIDKARQSLNRYQNMTELYNSLIYNYKVVPGAKYDRPSMQQVYIFNENFETKKVIDDI